MFLWHPRILLGSAYALAGGFNGGHHLCQSLLLVYACHWLILLTLVVLLEVAGRFTDFLLELHCTGWGTTITCQAICQKGEWSGSTECRGGEKKNDKGREEVGCWVGVA